MAKLYRVGEDGRAIPAKRLRAKDEGKELRDLLADNTFLLPGDQIDPEDPRRWLLISKEMPVPDPSSAANRWSVDLLLTDQAGIPTFVECKRYADTRARREVVGQMLEYAANGHFYWGQTDLLARLEARAQETGMTSESLVRDLRPEAGEGVEDLLSTFMENLREGQVRLVFFMEEAPQELKSIVDFLNRQTERTEILIVEAQHFEEGGDRFVVPILFGYTEEARRAKRSVNVVNRSGRKKWNEELFFEDAGSRLSGNGVEALRTILEGGFQLGFEVRWGTGSQRGSFSLVSSQHCVRSFMSLLSDGELWVNLHWIDGGEGAAALRELLCEEIPVRLGIPPPSDRTGFWSVKADQWVEKAGALHQLLEEISGGTVDQS